MLIQLPSVGAGNVLRDVIESGIATVTRLSQIFRQDDNSHIVSNAHLINEGQPPYTGNDSQDFFFFNIGEPEARGRRCWWISSKPAFRSVGDWIHCAIFKSFRRCTAA